MGVGSRLEPRLWARHLAWSPMLGFEIGFGFGFGLGLGLGLGLGI
ncbi:putative membrane protein [Burkholderia sp. ABCPW 111]|nr:putative membrane protein [Burkholderia sp. ABCPW 111]